jgi:acetoin utilization deacetylase AcuC-like enzyme
VRLRSIANRLRRLWHGRSVEVFHDPAYRLPLAALEGHAGFEPRRADFALWYLVASGAIGTSSLRRPKRITYQDLSRVHTPRLLDSLSHAQTLAAVFAVAPEEIRVDELLATVRLACGGTLLAARDCLAPGPPLQGLRALNLLGGFHHAGPDRAGGFCPVNDIAVSIAVLRAEGFSGKVCVLDLDAHPPDGTAECLRDDRETWIGSLSGADFGPLPHVDETVLPPGAGDAAYLAALAALLARMPPAKLAFVVAGGDVLAGDPLGQLGLTLDGARERDLLVAEALFRVPSVWLPGGGYREDSWRALAGTGLALSLASRAPVPLGFDPLGARFRSIARTLQTEALSGGSDVDLRLDDIAEDLGLRSPSRRLLLGFYTAEGIEHALSRYGILAQLLRLGYGSFRVDVSVTDEIGERMRLFGMAGGAEHLLVETVLERKIIDRAPVLYVHWLTLRNPLAAFTAQRPALPGQEVPGLGLAREAAELLARMAERLGLEGVAFRPASYHTAYVGRAILRFVDPARQGRFEALVRDLASVPLREAALLLASGRVRMNGAPYTWEPDEMARWLRPHASDEAAVGAERERVRFTVDAGAAAGSSAT